MAEDFENPRDEELSSLCAIYPEIQQLRPDDRYTITLDIPVNPSKAVTVFFPAAADDALPPRANNIPNGHNAVPPGQQGPVDSHELAYLPSIRLEITLGPHYPADKPPKAAISTNPPWLPAETVQQLQNDAPRLWEEMGRDMVGFTYIDYIQQAAENAFGLVDDKGSLEVDPTHKIAILDYDIKARKAAFEKETFDCGVCLDFYNNAIKEGDLAIVRCLAPNCAKERSKAASPSGRKHKKPRTFISPSELLQIPLEQETVKRYVALKYKTELESDKNTVYCPRSWCNGAARSKKHKKPQGLELAEDSDDSASEDEDEDDPEGKSKPYKAAEELLAICEECSFAFCSRCYQSWHGEFYRCTPPRDRKELTTEELASLEYMKLHTSPCPTCAAPAQKTHGCNHMICYRCQSHFCYLCSAWLDPDNPYQHFNEAPGGRITGCYMRLWELEQGDGDDLLLSPFFPKSSFLRLKNLMRKKKSSTPDMTQRPSHNSRLPTADRSVSPVKAPWSFESLQISRRLLGVEALAVDNRRPQQFLPPCLQPQRQDQLEEEEGQGRRGTNYTPPEAEEPSSKQVAGQVQRRQDHREVVAEGLGPLPPLGLGDEDEVAMAEALRTGKIRITQRRGPA
ncbi:hypothetical protein N0V88_001198 [Collariella sp. IMI 366227]|nr:hypothetical protein N0V88_001198 [Collariella sp. IMI 366227]